jgi:hypothetical protein
LRKVDSVARSYRITNPRIILDGYANKEGCGSGLPVCYARFLVKFIDTQECHASPQVFIYQHVLPLPDSWSPSEGHFINSYMCQGDNYPNGMLVSP